MKKFAKRLLSVALSVLIALSVMPTAFASAEQGPLTFSKTEVTVGEEFVMTLTLNETLTASSLGAHINFDNTAFEITAIDKAPYADMQPNLAGCNSNANVAISWCDPTFDANTTIEAGTVLLNVTLKAKEDATLGDKVFEIYDYNVTGAFNEETYEPENITPYIGERNLVVSIVEAAAEAVAPTIDTDVASAVEFLEGETAELSVAASTTDEGELSYQWYKDDAAIEGATAATLTVSEAGSYKVVVTNTLGESTATAESSVCVVTVNAPLVDADANNILLGKPYTHNVTKWHTANTAADNGFLTDGLKAGSWYDKSNVEYFAAKNQAVVEITFDMWYAREIKELNIEFIEDTAAGIYRPDYLEVYAINGAEETLIYDAKVPALDLVLVSEEAITAEKIKLVTTGGTYTFLDEVEAYAEATGEAGYAMGETAALENFVAGMTYTIEGVTKWYNGDTDDSAATKLTDGVLSWGKGYKSVNNFGANSSTAPVITFNFDEVKDIAEIDIYAVFGKDGIGAPPVVIEYADADGKWIKVADIAALEYQNFLVAKETLEATALRFTFAKGFCFLGEIQVYDRVTNMAATGVLVSNENYLLGRTYTHNVTTFNGASKDAGNALTDGVTGGNLYGSDYLNAKQPEVEIIFPLDKATPLSELYMQFFTDSGAAANLPAKLTVSIQEADDADWVKIYYGEVTANKFILGSDTEFTAKNIKLNFESNGNFVFVKEVEAYKYLTGKELSANLAVVKNAEVPTVSINGGIEEVTIPYGYYSLVATASVSDGGTLTYQWYKNDEALAQTNYYYTMFGGASAGTYKVVVTNTNEIGLTATAEATLEVKENNYFKNVAEGKSYEWISGMWGTYPDAGTELTDNVLSSWRYPTNEAYAGAKDPEIILDLGAVEEIYRVATLFMSTGSSGLVLPSSVKYQYSTDKETWYDFGAEWTCPDTGVANVLMITDANVAEPVEAQYIKLNATGGWVFLGEFMAYAEVIEAAAPVIEENPESVEIFEGDVANLNVIASVTDGGEISYQWYKDGEAVEGAIAPDFAVSEAGTYYVVVTNTLADTTASVTSTEAIVTVKAKASVPVIAPIEDVEILEGETATLEVVAEANGDLAYTWYFGEEVIGGEASVTVSEAGEYKVVVTNTLNGTEATAEATVTVTVLDVADAPVITAEPEDATIFEDEEATLAVEAEANGELSYQWYKDGVAIEGANDATYVTSEAGEYYAVVTNELNGETTTTETVKVTVVVLEHADAPVITAEPEDATIFEGETATLAVEAVANGELSYQWYKDGVAIEGATEATYVTSEAGEYYAVVTNELNGETTTTETVKVTVTVEELPVEFVAPELVFEGNVLTLKKNSAETVKVGAAYIGEATFEVGVDNWSQFVAMGSEYKNLNGNAGYVAYNNFTSKTYGTEGNYVAFVKYTDAEGVTRSTYYTFSLEAPEYTAPVLAFDAEGKKLTVEAGSIESYKVGVAYIGDATFTVGTDGWNEFVAMGQAYKGKNGNAGYVVYNTAPTKTYSTVGNYAAFIKFVDPVGNTVVEYYTFSIEAVKFGAPELVFEDNTLSLVKNDADSVKVGVAYIGDQTFEVGTDNWNEFVAMGSEYKKLNGSAGYVVYNNASEGAFRTYSTLGNYVAFVKYANNTGKTVSNYMTFTVA